MAQIYMDYAATTPVRKEVLQAMQPYYKEFFENPSGNYSSAKKVKEQIERARKEIAETIEASPEEIIFTSGGTESDNWAIRAALEKAKGNGKHIITSQMEHHAVSNTLNELTKQGYEVTYLPINDQGYIEIETLKKAIRNDTILISIMYANNEIGTIQPIREIAAIANKHHIIFHTDAVQAYGHLPISVKKEGIDLMSVSAHKFYGPKGIGFLYVRGGSLIPGMILGGNQENGLRAGTENTAGIIGMAAAAKWCSAHWEEEEQIKKLRDYFIDRVLQEIPYCRLNGGRKHRLSGNCNFSFQFLDGAELLQLLDENDICVSAGSACSSREKGPSQVLKALHLPEEVASGTLRMTLGNGNTKNEIDLVIKLLKKYITMLRDVSPEYEELLANYSKV